VSTTAAAAGEAFDPAPEKEDTLVGWVIFFSGVTGFLASSYFFVVMWRSASADSPGQLPAIPVLFCIEAAKCTILSALAAWAGKRGATRAGLDEPIARALVRGKPGAALRLLLGVLPGALAVGVAVCALDVGLWRIIAGEPLRATFAAVTHSVASPLVRATEVFYAGLGIELWFRWGITCPVASAAVRRGATPDRAFWRGSVAAAIAYGIFALPTSIGAPPFVHSVVRFGSAGFVTSACASIAYGLLMRRRGLAAAAIAHGVTAFVRVVVCPAFF